MPCQGVGKLDSEANLERERERSLCFKYETYLIQSKQDVGCYIFKWSEPR
uniref:Uncharacterized protein n=1 Tax=Arundo donax TaxID=35708 RepID=A0A0A9FF99_ARUDO